MSSVRSILLERYQNACRELVVLPSPDVENWILSGPLDAPHFSASAGLVLAPRDASSPDVLVDRMVPLLNVLSLVPLREVSLEGCSLAESQLENAVSFLFLEDKEIPDGEFDRNRQITGKSTGTSSNHKSTLQALMLRGNKINRKIFDRILEVCATHATLLVVRLDPAPQCSMQKLEQACALNENKQAAKAAQGSTSSPLRLAKQSQSFVVAPKRSVWQPSGAVAALPSSEQVQQLAANSTLQHVRLTEMLAGAIKSIDFGFGSTSHLPHALFYFVLHYFQHVAASSESYDEVVEHMRRTEARFLDWRRLQLSGDEPATVVLHQPLQDHIHRLIDGSCCVYCGGDASTEAALALHATAPRLLLNALLSEAAHKGACFVEDTPAFVINLCHAILLRMRRTQLLAGGDDEDPLAKSFQRPPDFCSEKCLKRFSRSMLCEAKGLPYGVAPMIRRNQTTPAGNSSSASQVGPSSTCSSKQKVVFIGDVTAAIMTSEVEAEACTTTVPPGASKSAVHAFPCVASVAAAVKSVIDLRAVDKTVDEKCSTLSKFSALSPVTGSSILDVCSAVCSSGAALHHSRKGSCIQPSVCVSFAALSTRKPGQADASALLRQYFRCVRDAIRGSPVVLGIKIYPSVIERITARKKISDDEPVLVIHDPRAPDCGGVASAVVLYGTRAVDSVVYFVASYSNTTLLIDEYSINAAVEKYGACSFAEISWGHFSVLTGSSRALRGSSLPVGLVEYPNYAELSVLLLLKHPAAASALAAVEGGASAPKIATVDDDALRGGKASDAVMACMRESITAPFETVVKNLGLSVGSLVQLVSDYRRGNFVQAALSWGRMQQQLGGGAEFVKAMDKATRHLFGTHMLHLHPNLQQTLGTDFLPTVGRVSISAPVVRHFVPDLCSGELVTNGQMLADDAPREGSIYSLLKRHEDGALVQKRLSFAQMQGAAEFTVHGRIPTACWAQQEGVPLLVTEVVVEYNYGHCAELAGASRSATLQVSFSDDGRNYTTVCTDGPLTASPGTSGTVTIKFGNIGSHRFWRVQYLPFPIVSSGGFGSPEQFEQQRTMTCLLTFTGLYFNHVVTPLSPSSSFCFESTASGKSVFSFDGQHAVIIPSDIPTHELTQQVLTAASDDDLKKGLVDLLRSSDGFFCGIGIQPPQFLHTVIRRGKHLLVFTTNAEVSVCDSYSGQVLEPLTPVAQHYQFKKLPPPMIDQLDGGVLLDNDIYLLFSGEFFALVDFSSMAVVCPVTSWFRNVPGRALAELDSNNMPLGTKLLTSQGEDPYHKYYFPFRSVSCIHRMPPTSAKAAQNQVGVELLVISGERCLKWLVPPSASAWAGQVRRRSEQVIPVPSFRRCDVIPTPFDGVPVAQLYEAVNVIDPSLIPVIPLSITVLHNGSSVATLPSEQCAKLGERRPNRRIVEPMIRHPPSQQTASSGCNAIQCAELRFSERTALSAIDVIADPCGAIWRIDCVNEENGNVGKCGEIRQTTSAVCRIALSTAQASRIWRLVGTISASSSMSLDGSSIGIYGLSCLIRRPGQAKSAGISSRSIFQNTAVISIPPASPTGDQQQHGAAPVTSSTSWVPIDSSSARLVVAFSITRPLFAVDSSRATIKIAHESSPDMNGEPVTSGVFEVAGLESSTTYELEIPQLCRWVSVHFHTNGPSAASQLSTTATTTGQLSASYIPLACSPIRNIPKKPATYVEAAAAAAAVDFSNTSGQLRREDRSYIVYLDRPLEAACRLTATAFTTAADVKVAGINLALFYRSSENGEWLHLASSTVQSVGGIVDCCFGPMSTPVVAIKFHFDQAPRVSVRDVCVLEAVMPSIDFANGLVSATPLSSSSATVRTISAPHQLFSQSSRPVVQLVRPLHQDQTSANDEVVSFRIPAHMSCVQSIVLKAALNGITVTGTLINNSRRVLYSSEKQHESAVGNSTTTVRLPPTALRAVSIAGQISSISNVLLDGASTTETILGRHKHQVAATLHYGGKSADIIHSPFEFPARVGTSISIRSADGLASVLQYGQLKVSSTISGITFDVQIFDDIAGFFRSVSSVTTNSSAEAVSERWSCPYQLSSTFRLVCSGIAGANDVNDNNRSDLAPLAVLSISLTQAPVLDCCAPFTVRSSAACRILTNGIVKTAHRKNLHCMMSTKPLGAPIVRFSGEVESPDEEQLAPESGSGSAASNGSSNFYVTIDLLATGEQNFVGLAVLTSGDTDHEILAQYSDDNAQYTTVAVHRQDGKGGWCFSSWTTHGTHRYWRISATIISIASRRRSRRSTSIAEIEEGDDQALNSLIQPVNLRGINNVVWYVSVPESCGECRIPFTAQESEAMLRAQRAPLLAIPNHDMLLFHALPIGLPPATRRVALAPTERGENPKQAAALTRAARSRVSPSLVHASAAMEKSLNTALPNIENVLRVMKPEAAVTILHSIFGRPAEKLTLTSARVSTISNSVSLDPSVVVQGWTAESFLGLSSGTQVSVSIQLSELVQAEGTSVVQRVLLVAEQSWNSLRASNIHFDAAARLFNCSALPDQILAVHRWSAVEVLRDDPELFGESYSSIPAPSSSTKPELLYPVGTQHIIRSGTTAVFPRVSLDAFKAMLLEADRKNSSSSGGGLSSSMSRLCQLLGKLTHGQAIICVHANLMFGPKAGASDIVTVDVSLSSIGNAFAEVSDGGSTGGVALAGSLRLQILMNPSTSTILEVSMFAPAVFQKFFGEQHFLLHARLAAFNSITQATEVPDVVVCGAAMIDGGASMSNSILPESLISLRSVSAAMYLHVDKATISHVTFSARTILSSSILLACKLLPAPEVGSLLCIGHASAVVTAGQIGEYIASRAAGNGAATSLQWRQLFGDIDAFSLQDSEARWTSSLATPVASSRHQICSSTAADFNFEGLVACNGSLLRGEVTFTAYPKLAGRILRLMINVRPNEKVQLLQPGLWFSDGTLIVDVGLDGHIVVDAVFRNANLFDDEGDRTVTNKTLGGSRFLESSTFSIRLRSATNEKTLTVHGHVALNGSQARDEYSARLECKQGFRGGLLQSSFNLVEESDLASRVEHEVLNLMCNERRTTAMRIHKVLFARLSRDDELPIRAAKIAGLCNGCQFEEIVSLSDANASSSFVDRLLSTLANRFAVAFWNAAARI